MSKKNIVTKDKCKKATAFAIAAFSAVALMLSSCNANDDNKNNLSSTGATDSIISSSIPESMPTETTIGSVKLENTETIKVETVTTTQAPVETVTTKVTTQAPVITTKVTTQSTTQAPVVTTTQMPVVNVTQAPITTVAASAPSNVQGVAGVDVLWLNRYTSVPINQNLKLRFGAKNQTEMKAIYDAVYYLFNMADGDTISIYDDYRDYMIKNGEPVSAWQDINPSNDTYMHDALKFCAFIADGPCGGTEGIADAYSVLSEYSPNYFAYMKCGNCSTQVMCYRAVLNWWGFETRYIGGYDAKGSGARHAMLQIKRPNGKWQTFLSIYGDEDESNGSDNVIGCRVRGFIIDRVITD